MHKTTFDKYLNTYCTKVTAVSNYKVRLVPISSLKFGDTSQIANTQVVFEVTPTFTESRQVAYSAVTPIHMPGSIQMYQSTSARSFDITATLIARNAADAAKNRQCLQTLRGWTMPYFGSTSTLTKTNRDARINQSLSPSVNTLNPEDREKEIRQRIQDAGVELRGAPPDVLYLYAYSAESSSVAGGRSGATSNINRVPVVLTSLSIAYPDDVDYIPVADSSGNIEPFPVKMSVSLNLAETHSPREYERFDLNAFKAGTLANF